MEAEIFRVEDELDMLAKEFQLLKEKKNRWV